MSVLNTWDGPPGPMGWGDDNDMSTTERLGVEDRTFDQFLKDCPAGYTLGRRPAKDVVNQELSDSVIKIQNANGIEDGFCFLFLAEAIFGQQLDWISQKIGSCVASGDMRTTSYRMLAEIFLNNQTESLPGIDIEGTDALAPFAAFNYRAGRKLGGLNGRGDGSFCAAHIRGKMQYGHLFCNANGLTSDAYPEPQRTSTYKAWGANDTLLNQFKDQASPFKLLESDKVGSAQDAKELIFEHKKPLNICSSWGFAVDYKHPTWKDADGQPVYIYKRSGSWAHNMSVIGFVQVNGKWFAIIENSWGNYHRGRKWFAIPASLLDSWLGRADCRSVGEIDLTDNAPPWPAS